MVRRPCNCNRARVGIYSLEQCRICWHALNSPGYQRLWGLSGGVEVVDCCGPPTRGVRSVVLPRVLKAPLLGRVITIGGGPVVWACGVTTIEGRESLLQRTLGSLALGGFGQPQVFAERGLKAFGTWWHSLVELWIRNPHADRYAMFQDDLVCVRGLRHYLDRVPHPEAGYWNLFTSRENEVLAKEATQVGFVEGVIAKSHGPGTGQQAGRGALALVFPRKALLELLTSRHLVERPMDRPPGMEPDVKILADRSIDGCVVTAMNKAGFREYVHCPSLVQHTGDRSTISYEAEDALLRAGVRRQRIAKSFPGESFDALSFLGKTV